MRVEGKMGRALGLLAAAALAALGLVAATQAAGIRAASTATVSYIYMVQGGTSIGRVSTDGGTIDWSFLSTANGTNAVAVDGQHVYWANEGSQIGRANLDGSDATESFISGTSFDPNAYETGLAVDGQHIYWTNANSIGRANLDGAGVDETFISGVTANALAVNGQYIYWDQGSQIGRANLDGSAVDPALISSIGGQTGADGLALDSQHIYWSNPRGGISRANLDGSGLVADFIDGCQTTGNLTTCGSYDVATDSQHIYWIGPYFIGKANLDGSGFDPNFVRIPALGYKGPELAVSPPVTVPTTTGTSTGTTTTSNSGPSVTVLVKIKGKGKVSGGITCPSNCKAAVAKGRSLTIRARAARGYRFAGWGGACPSKLWGLGGCTIAVYLHGGHLRTQAKITGQSLWAAFATPNAAGAVRATATFVRKR